MQNSVVKIVSDYLEWERTKLEIGYDNLSSIEKDELRLKNDNDAKYYFSELNYDPKNALRADSIASFWTPYRTLLKKEAGWDAYKTSRSLESLLKQINASWSNAFTEKINAVNLKLETFASLCYTPGNYMILPKRIMNIHRYQKTEDRIDLTLHECFEGGCLSAFFQTEADLINWIKIANLDCLFESDEIMQKNLILFSTKSPINKRISEMEVDEIYNYLAYVIDLIKTRNTVIEEKGGK